MLILAILLGLTPTGDVTKAAASYSEGLGYVEKAQWERAIEAFDAALKEVPNENESLSTRAQGIVSKVKYYPYAQSGIAMLALAESSLNLEEKNQRLGNAINRLVRSELPEAKAALAKARRSKEVVEAKLKEEAAPKGPDPFPAVYAKLKGNLDGYSVAERFEDALDLAGKASELTGHDAEKRDLLKAIRDQQSAAVGRRSAALDLEMERLGNGKPLENPAAHLRALEAARVAPALQRDCAARFRWLDEFLAAGEKHRDSMDKAAQLDERTVCDAAQAFDQLAERALDADFLAGFQAARNVGHGLRLTRMSALLSSPLDASAKWDRGVLIDAAAEEARRKGEEPLKSRIDRTTDAALKEGMQRYLTEIGPAQRRAVAAILGQLPRPDTVERIAKAEKGLQTRSVVADPGRLRGIGTDLAALQSDGEFAKLAAADQARALFVAAAAQAVADFLDGDPREKILERWAPLAGKAYALDAGVDGRWRDQLSPKVLSLLAESRKR